MADVVKREAGERPAVRVRGIYATALSLLLVELGFQLAEPSPQIARLLRLSQRRAQAVVSLDDLSDRHGVLLQGDAAVVSLVADGLSAAIPGTIRVPRRHERALIFSSIAKSFLDSRRRQVVPTVGKHHLMNANGVLGVDRLESGLRGKANDWDSAGEEFWQTAVTRALHAGLPVKIVHGKPWKRDLVMAATVESFRDGVLKVRRLFRSGGRYDSLNVPKLPGDWGRVEIVSEGWALRRTYFRATGALLGELYNIQTPAEIGPAGVWYVDLEVDVVRLPDGSVTIVDLPDLDRLASSGFVAPALLVGAREVAEQLSAILQEYGDWTAARSYAFG